MIRYALNDTIAAISTAIGEAGIGIVRISGKDALSLADKIFYSKDVKKPSCCKTYTLHYGWIVDRIASKDKRPSVIGHRSSREIIDEVILTVMRAPKSYTKEDVVEINCHGGITPLRKILDLVLAEGARLAEPGEFTQRAFLNGRIDLPQAEAVLDIIRAKTESALRIGVEQLKGTLSRRINSIREALLTILSSLEANIDFPEEDTGLPDSKTIRRSLENINQQLKSMLEASNYGRILREGLNTVICGRANVGKSSLLNAILKHERSIVTPIAGTTRDTIEEVINIKGIPLKIIDTAGIVEPRGLIEQKAVLRSKKYIDSADLIILVFDGSKRLDIQDRILIKKLNKKRVLAVINKIDLRQKIEKERLSDIFHNLVSICAKKNKNIDLLEEAIASLITKGKIAGPEAGFVTNIRHIEKLKGLQKFVAQAINSLDNNVSIEFVAQDLKDALTYLDEILGRRFAEDLLDKIFGQFCIGK
jgi:tRNA modification GTPase